MADHDKPERVTVDPALVAREIPQGAIAIGESHLHETSEVRLKPIVTTTAAILLTVILADLAVLFLYKFWQARHDAADTLETPLLLQKPEVTGPKLQVDEPAHLANQRIVDLTPISTVHQTSPGYASVPVDEAVAHIATSGKLPEGPDWSLRPGEQMINGVIMTPEQVKYANTPPSQALVESTGVATTVPTPSAGAPPSVGANAGSNPASVAKPAGQAPPGSPDNQ